jgi:hypothetical protein
VPEGYKVAVFANGCFWGSEKGIWRLPAGIHSTAVGYCAGFTPNPTYEEVCVMRMFFVDAYFSLLGGKVECCFVEMVDSARNALRARVPESVHL